MIEAIEHLPLKKEETARLLLHDNRVKELSKMQLLHRVEELQTENTLLRQKVDLLVRKIFGASSEKLDAAQLDLFLLQVENTRGKSAGTVSVVASLSYDTYHADQDARCRRAEGRDRASRVKSFYLPIGSRGQLA